MKPWWERFPGRLDREIASLGAHGIAHRRDDLAWRQGQLVLDLTLTPPRSDTAVYLRAFYPETFPYQRFEVVAPDLALTRHQNPFGKNVCLLGRPSVNWSVYDTLGELLVAQLPKVMRFITEDHEKLRDIEERQGEPFSDFYAYVANTAVLVDTSWQIGPGPIGRLRLVYSEAVPFRGAIAEVQDANGEAIVSADEAMIQNFPNTARGWWVRWESPIVETDARRILALVSLRYKGFAQPGSLSRKRAAARSEPDVVGIVFPEEAAPGEQHDAWLFVIRGADGRSHLARTCRAGQTDLGSRAPELAPLRQKSIAAIGMGSIGAPSAIEFARNGVKLLNIADYDFVEAGTVSRWPLGLSTAGRLKVEALFRFFAENYPHTRVEKFCGMIGHGQRPSEPFYSDHRDLDRLLNADLVYDATAETGIQLLLADLAAERGIPYISVSTTPGAWGGVIFRQSPSAERACWSCFQYAMRDGKVPTPLADPSGMLQPAGCAAPTFTGASFDIQTVSTMAVRIAVATLCSGHEKGYPAFDWDVAVVNLRTPRGEPIAPQWHTVKLERHAECGNEIAHRTNLAPSKAA
jgi:molybdopterin/thiamine biosynthesis adenylyltransferase